jgi:hypothetical protein
LVRSGTSRILDAPEVIVKFVVVSNSFVVLVPEIDFRESEILIFLLIVIGFFGFVAEFRGLALLPTLVSLSFLEILVEFGKGLVFAGFLAEFCFPLIGGTVKSLPLPYGDFWLRPFDGILALKPKSLPISRSDRSGVLLGSSSLKVLNT